MINDVRQMCLAGAALFLALNAASAAAQGQQAPEQVVEEKKVEGTAAAKEEATPEVEKTAAATTVAQEPKDTSAAKKAEQKQDVATQRTEVCEVEVTANDAMQYSTKEITIGAQCAQLKLTLKSTGKLPKTAMGHNLVIAEASQVDQLIAAGLKAGPAQDYIPKSEHVLAATKLLGGGESDTITVDVAQLGGKNLQFFCLFPGHTTVMRGSVKVEGAQKPSS